MKKTLLFLLIFFLTTSAFSDTYNAENHWGSHIELIKKTIPQEKKTSEFNPKTEPNYKNKILNYILAIDESKIDKINILRVNSKPQIDYLFINNNLYSIMVNWKTIDTGFVSKIKSDLEAKFGAPSLQQDDNKYIYSFSKDKTKVLLYVLKMPGHISKCKVYYYTKSLFKMLMFE